ncbi:class I SAM-dependent RNA methyltransferase [Flexivirga caeni]|uniref:Class I SAM-dependent RNA methyltransferase n=1 Tax=Flexivirga caeni TaxID=2294115 RepID=A0A3M9LYK7_9MICO|nr:TRAM domain-containing protein [Flexivirga caeni]RNI18380.1 class I SAM-dependent RNA methyltransferase [Flexivirga caeni]
MPAAQGVSLVGERFTVEVGPVAHGGHCVARHDGQVIFVRHALPGERVVVAITGGGAKSRFLRGDVVEILQSAPERRTAPCRFAGPGGCGGCDWQHTSAAYGRELKRRVVAEQLRRLAGIEWPGDVEPVPGDVEGLRWRTRVEFAAARGSLGLRKHHSHEVVPVDDCLIAVPDIAATGLLTEPVPRGVTGVDVAVGSDGEVVAVDLPVADDEVPDVVERVTVPGRGARDFAVSARGFWQVHPGAAAAFVAAALDGLEPSPGERALDLYAGVGVFTAFLADAVGPAGRVLGLEGDERAVRDGRLNLAGLGQASLRRSGIGRDDWSDALGELDRVDLVVLDPPRSGAGRDVVATVFAHEPRRAAYIACDPAALARDLSYAADAGYEVRSLRAFDAFPMTHHVECVAILAKTG